MERPEEPAAPGYPAPVQGGGARRHHTRRRTSWTGPGYTPSSSSDKLTLKHSARRARVLMCGSRSPRSIFW